MPVLPEDTPPNAGRPRGSRRGVLAVSTLAMGLGAGPTYLVGYLGAELRADLGASGAQLGLLVGLFYGATGVVSLLAAPVVDALGARRCVVGDQVLVTVCLVAAAATGRLAVLAAASALAGAGYAFANAGTSMAVTAVSPRNQAGAAVAVKTAGIPAAATVLALAGPPLASLVGWQGVCLLLAAGTAGTAAAALLVLPDARPQRAGTRRTAGPPLPRGFVWVVLAATCFVVGNQPLSSFLVLTLVDGGTSPVAAGLVSATGTGAGAVAMVLAARRGDRSGPHRRAATAAGVGTVILTGTVLLWTGTHVGLPLVVAGAVLGLVGAMVGAGFSHAVAVDRAPLSVGRATAVMSCGYYLGALAAPLLFGTLADRTGDYDASWAVTVVAAGSSVTFFVVVQLRVRPPVAEPVRRPAPPPSSPRP